MGWTGAEIKSCWLAALLDVSLTAAARNVVPVAVTAAESVDQLRDWASGRCLSADPPGIYQKPAATPARRKVAAGGQQPLARSGGAVGAGHQSPTRVGN